MSLTARHSIKLGTLTTSKLTLTTLATTGVAFDFGGKDFKTVIIVKNSDSTNAEELTICGGNGIQEHADVTVSIPKSETHVIALDAGEFKLVSGTNKGGIVLKGSTDLSAAVVAID